MKKGRLMWTVLSVLLVAAATLAAPGDWKGVGKPGDWKNTLAGVVLHGKLYTAETSGALYETDPATGQWKQIGKLEFGKTRFMFAGGTSLYTIETDGNFYKVNPKDGTWKGVGKPGDWKNTLAGAMLGGKLYTAETSGALYETDPDTGQWKQIGKSEFGNTRFMFAAAGSIYTIESDGSLYRVSVK